MKRPRARTLLAGAIAAAASASLPQIPAHAECIYAVVYVTRVGDTPIYASNGCVYPTPWNQAVLLPGQFTLTNPSPPTGAPNGYFVDIRIPVP